MKKKLLVAIVPAYNEQFRIKNVINHLQHYVNKIIIIDDGSTDDILIKDFKSSKIYLLKHLVNLGQGAALQTGFEFAKKLNPDIVVTFDADGQFIPSEIPRIITPIMEKNYDVTLGSRFIGQTINMPFTKFIVLKFGILFTFLFSGVLLTDTHNGFRAFSKKALSKINITQNRMAHASEIIDLIKQSDLRYIEIPVTIQYDASRKGQSYLNALNIVINLISQKLT